MTVELLITGLVLGLTHFFKLTWRKVTGEKPDDQYTVGFAVLVGFGLFLLHATVPTVFTDQVVQAAGAAVAIPGSFGAFLDLVHPKS